MNRVENYEFIDDYHLKNLVVTAHKISVFMPVSEVNSGESALSA